MKGVSRFISSGMRKARAWVDSDAAHGIYVNHGLRNAGLDADRVCLDPSEHNCAKHRVKKAHVR